MMEEVENFTVDAHLLRELGERLVGRPYLALAELVKNAYDADARNVIITFDHNHIVVEDDGHGMSHDDFSQRWMRIGTIEKQRNRLSPELRRSVTGSKGIGRLSVQTLAHRMSLATVGLRDPKLAGSGARRHPSVALHPEVRARVDWDEAVEADELTKVSVLVQELTPMSTFAGGSLCGTRLVLRDLLDHWGATEFRSLARELWALQPPRELIDKDTAFRVELRSSYFDVVDEFDAQMHAIFDVWTARVYADLLPLDDEEASRPPDLVLPSKLPRQDSDPFVSVSSGSDGTAEQDGRSGGTFAFPTRLMRVTVQLRNEQPREFFAQMPNCRIDQLRCEVLVFDLANRQPYGIQVGVAREYIKQYGGLNVFDGTFRLPYSGSDDWLQLERAHAARLSTSKLLPKSLWVHNALQDLPTTSRIYGNVSISTTHEARVARQEGRPRREILDIQTTRDRLVDNAAYWQLQVLVRAGLDLYATERARQKTATSRPPRRAASDAPPPTPASSFRAARDVVAEVRAQMSPQAFDVVSATIDEAIRDAVVLEEDNQYLQVDNRNRAALLGALATAGMVSMAYHHELARVLHQLDGAADDLDLVAAKSQDRLKQDLTRTARDLRTYIRNAGQLGQVFSGLTEEESRTKISSFRAKRLVDNASTQLTPLARGSRIDLHGIPDELMLPRGSWPAWLAVFQNLFANSFNALLDVEGEKRIDVDAGTHEHGGWIRVQDTGVGVDLAKAERYFEPFERGLPPSRHRTALRIGGSGLGLTIVRMICEEFDCEVSFTRPDAPHSTAITVNWTISR